MLDLDLGEACRALEHTDFPRTPATHLMTLHASLLPIMLDRSVALHNVTVGRWSRELLAALWQLGFQVRPHGATLRVHKILPQAAGVARIEIGHSEIVAPLAGTLAGRGTQCVVDGHQPEAGSIRGVVEPLRALGAEIEYLGEPDRLPIAIHSGVSCSMRSEVSVSTVQARSAVLLACIAGDVPVTITQVGYAWGHVEQLMAALGAKLVAYTGQVQYLGGGLTAA